MEWCTIESDPAVFTELTERLGLETQMEIGEVFSMEDVESQADCAGFILLFRYDKGTMRPSSSSSVGVADDPSVFFCKQTVENACGTIALLHVLLNAEGVRPGPKLTNFLEFASSMPEAELRGEILGMSDDIRKAHNSFARSEPFMSEEKGSSEGGEAFHFVAYVPKNGALYELDGLQRGPIRLEAVPESAPTASGAAAATSAAAAAGAEPAASWLPAARRAVEERMARYSGTGEIRFTLLSVKGSRLHAAKRRLGQASARLAVAQQVLSSGGGSTARANAMVAFPQALLGAGWAPEPTLGALETQVAELEVAARAAKAEVDELQAERAAWAAENERRKHNWVPFAIALLEECHRAGKLDGMVEKGNERARELVRQEMERESAKKAKAASPSSAAPSASS
ncbi:hypothetical protein FNF29_03341 [Cafeteria roenbergensis]|uniref:Ubiquitin carboxyl-terminal hydrolase n=1 Tax=Cafeteria roenbergensis TaxID=33653 RepID=A0A5A8CJ99_CAFRO|nr:hypothetical protein FNF29_03341 [Cafeteria roenbergensis]|eukprot:KAA0153153.1 hypothetical protein FNF29_03341 [Cafeteria roenbergensis]